MAGGIPQPHMQMLEFFDVTYKYSEGFEDAATNP